MIPEPVAPPDSLYSLWYYPCINRFLNDDGDILHDLSDKFDVWQLDEWKQTHDYGILLDRNGDWCELYYQKDYQDWTFIEHNTIWILHFDPSSQLKRLL